MTPDEIAQQIHDCTGCELHETCRRPVPFTGQPTRLALIGGSPREDDDTTGIPFSGLVGAKLRELLAESGVTEDWAAFNTISCHPPRDVKWTHINACKPNYNAQLAHLNPTVALLLGRVALGAVRPDLSLKHARGRPFKIDGRLYYATYHPAATLKSTTFEYGCRADLERFSQLLVDLDRWEQMVPDECAGCDEPAIWYEATGLGWCPEHLPPAERILFEQRATALAKDRDQAVRNAAEARDDAVGAVASAADPDWMTRAWHTLIHWLKTHDEFFVDDFWTGTGLDEPREARALGAIVRRAASQGLMTKTGEFRKSVRSHLTEKPVWRSEIRKQPGP